MTIAKKLAALCFAATTLVSSATFAAEVTLKASHNANPDEPYHLGMQRMNELLMEKTGGKAEIQVFSNAQLGDEMESIQGTQIGTVDIAVTANELLVNFVPDMGVLSLPFLFDDALHMDRTLKNEDVVAQMNEILTAKGFRLIGIFSAGTRHIMTKKPVETIEDMADLKIRTMQTPAHLDTFKQFGANPTPMAYTELYGALETGVVDGAEAANTNYHSQKFYEVAPNWAILGWLEIVAPVVMGEARFQQLPEDVQAALLEAGAEAAAYQRETYRNSDEERYEQLVAAGVNVTHPDDAPFRARAEEVYAAYTQTDAQKKLLELLKSVD